MILNKNKKLSTGEVARLCGATTASVNNWIKSKKIKAYNTPGGQYRIIVEDLIKFIRENNMPVPEELKELIKERILIIDDNYEDIKVLEQIIKNLNKHIELYITDDGYEGLIKAGEVQPDLIFLNIGLSGIDAIKACESLISNKYLNRTLVFIVGNDFSRYREKILTLKVDEVLEKPLSIKKIKSLLLKVLNL